MIASVSRCQPVMGTYVEIALRGARTESELLALSTAAFAELRAVEWRMSFHAADSELSHLNRHAADGPVRISGPMHEVLREALLLGRLSAGLFDITVAAAMVRSGALPARGMQASPSATWRDIDLRGTAVRYRRPLLVDLGGIAKGYAIDRAMAVLPDDVEATINAGGDLRMNPWAQRSVAVRVPSNRERMVLLRMRNAAMATSAAVGAGRSGLIMSPRRGAPCRSRRSVSVFACSAMRADALTKIAILQPRCRALLRELGAEAVYVGRDGTIDDWSARGVVRS
jgi:thiamine biosynthesis lipoprotein